MPLRSDWSDTTCPIARAADVLADPWIVLILRELFSGRTRFDDLRDATGAADSVLARRLRAMVDAGLVAHSAGGDYRLTRRGEETLPIIHAYALFTRATEPDGPWGLEISCSRCGGSAQSADWCAACDRPLTAATTAWKRPSLGGAAFALAAGAEA